MEGYSLVRRIRHLTSGIFSPLLRRFSRLRRVRPHVGRVLFFSPALILLILLVIYPVLQTIFLGFYFGGPGGTREFAGLENYRDVLTDPATINAGNLPWPPPLGTLLHNALWIVIHLPISLFAGLWLALLLQETKGASFVKSCIFLGMVTPMIVGGVILRFLLEQGVGIIPSFFQLIGAKSLAVNWMVHRELLLLGLIMGSVWLWTGFSLVVYSAGLTTIPKDYFEAARVDGTPPSRMFFRITFPLLKPLTLVIVVMTILWELKIFDIVVAATNFGGGVGADTLALQVYRFFFYDADSGRAAVVASLLTLLTLLSTSLILRRMAK
jgi:multiple sugar transport system permease protein